MDADELVSANRKLASTNDGMRSNARMVTKPWPHAWMLDTSGERVMPGQTRTCMGRLSVAAIDRKRARC